MNRIPLSSSDFSRGLYVPANPLSAPENTHGLGSRNQIFTGTGRRPWLGMTALGPGTRLSRQVGGTYGGLRDYVSGVPIQGKGSFFSDIGKSLWFIGAGTPSIETVDIGAGITAATDLQVSIAVASSYSAANTFTAGLPQPSPPDVAIPAIVSLGLTGFINGPVSAKIARVRLSTGARSRASTTSAVISPANKTVRITYPLPSIGQDTWHTFFTQSGFGGIGLEYGVVAPGLTSMDIPETLVAASTVDGVARSIEFDFKDGDLLPILAYIDDYVPPAGTHAVRLQNVMCVLGCYGDSSSPVSSTNTGTAGAISLPNYYESYKPRDLIYFPEQIVDAMARPTDEFAYVGHADCVTAMQYVGVRNGPAVSLTMIWPDIGIKHPCNWTQVHGLLYVMSANGGPVRMRADGGVDYDFALPVREFMRTWTQDDTAVGWHPNSMCVVYFNKTLGVGVSFSLVNEGWGDPCYFPDANVSGGALSVTNTVGRMIVTVDNGGTHTAYAWDEGATSMPITSVTNWRYTGKPATIEEMSVGFNVDNFASPMIIGIHRNQAKTFVQDGATTNGSSVVTSASAVFSAKRTNDMLAIYGTNVGGLGVNFLIARMTYVSPTTVTISDPYTGAALTAGATLANCYITFACQIFPYVFTESVSQFTPPLLELFVDEAISHALSFTLLTNATAGQILTASVAGSLSMVPVALAV